MDIKSCPKCNATWIAGQLHWKTGAAAKEEDLAGLVCNDYGGEECINPKLGDSAGDTWEKRLEAMEEMTKELQRKLKE